MFRDATRVDVPQSDPVQEATQTANNNFQTAGLAANNAVPKPIMNADSQLASQDIQTNNDPNNYDQTDRLTEAELPQAPPTSDGDASELPEERKRRIGVSLDRSKKVRVKPPEE